MKIIVENKSSETSTKVGPKSIEILKGEYSANKRKMKIDSVLKLQRKYFSHFDTYFYSPFFSFYSIIQISWMEIFTLANRYDLFHGKRIRLLV